jgi:alpha-D-ribose 1-methylphosphonate 5-triphosphate synthase subunit PhnH
MSVLSHDFADPVFAAQSTFRAIMNACARPGSLQSITGAEEVPPPLSAEAASVALTLLDHDTPVWLDEPLSRSPDIATWLRFRTGAPIVGEPGNAAFALIADPQRMPPFEAFNAGLGDYPDRSATLILQVAAFAGSDVLTLTGPGIRGEATFAAAHLPADMAGRIAANRSLFPRGVDLLFVAQGLAAAIPRSVRLKRG